MKHSTPQTAHRTDEIRAQARRMATQAQTADTPTARDLYRTAYDLLTNQRYACLAAGKDKTARRLATEAAPLRQQYLALI